jgi:hypothetical protein
MDSNEIIYSTPYTIQNYNNYLKDYVNVSGFQWDSICLEVAFKNLGDNFEKYIQKVGDYNTVTATNPEYIPPRSYQEKDYSRKCPEGWTEINNSCKNQYYSGPCFAGRTRLVKSIPSCPNKYYGELKKANENYYVGWYGPTDASQADLSNTNIGRKNQDEGNFCYAGWAAKNSLGGAKADCDRSGGQWVNYYDDPGFWRHSYTCYKPNKFDNVSEPPSYFDNYTDEQKRNWENSCQAYWPMKTINIPGKWTCTYGETLEDDIASGRIFQIGFANSPVEAAKFVLKSYRLIDNYFFMIDNEIYIIGLNNNVGVITSKGYYQPNCSELKNKKGTLYYISQEFFNMLQQCKVVNDKINDININRNILRDSTSSLKENFTGDSKNNQIIENLISRDEITKNQNEITTNLVKNYNKKAELYNYQVDLIGQNEKLVESHNKKINNQFNDLKEIQEQIALKDRVIELNEELVKKQIRNKKILIGFFVLLPFFGIPFILVLLKIFKPSAGLGLAGLMTVCYIIYVIFIYNQSDKMKFGKEEQRIIPKYEKSLINYWNKQKEELNKSLSEFVNGKCLDQEEIDDKYNINIAYPRDGYLMKSNGPLYYYDGSAPPQQIYPSAIGSIEFNIEGKNQEFPNNFDFDKIKNPITKFFFIIWMDILLKNGIEIDDPRFNEVLDVIDFPDTDQTPMPFWDNIKLPIVTNINQQFNYLFQSYSGEKKNLSQTASVLLVDLWNFIFGDKIPSDVYEKWLKRLADLIKETRPNIENFYENYLEEIMGSLKFTEKYGSGNAGLDKFVEIKMVDFIKTFNEDISVSQPFAKKYVP